MKLTRQRKIYAAFLGLAALAFAADRMFFLPAGAQAAPNTAGPAESPPLSVAKDSAATEPNEPTLAARLRVAAGATNDLAAPDPFQARWRPAGKGAALKAVVGRSPGDYFAATHRLTSVSAPRGDGHALAQIGKTSSAAEKGTTTKVYRVGEVVDGWTLTAVDIQESSATLESPAGTVTLRLGIGTKGR